MEVRRVTSAEELRRVGRIRYERFVEERGCRLPGADHQRRLLLEPVDASAILLGGYVRGELVGSVRLHLGLPEEYRQLYGLAECPPEHQRRVSVTSRLVVAAGRRSLARAALRLAQSGFENAALRGNWLNFIDCNQPLRAFFRALGFLELASGPVEHPVFGTIHPMAVVLPALDHFRRLRSPFAAVAARSFGPADLPEALRLLARLAPPAKRASALGPLEGAGGVRPPRPNLQCLGAAKATRSTSSQGT